MVKNSLEYHKKKLLKKYNGLIILLSNEYTFRRQNHKYYCTSCKKEFLRKPGDMVSSHKNIGCPYCARIKQFNTTSSNKGIMYAFSLILKFRGNIINIEKYKGRFRNIEHKCSKHGIFIATPDTILRRNRESYGCPKCALEGRSTIRMTKDLFLKRLQTKHKNKVKLISPYISIQAIHTFQCDKGHKWKTTADSIVRVSGCPICCRSPSYSIISNRWLNECLNYFNANILTFETNTKEVAFKFKNDKKPFRVDGYDPTTKTVYEFYGDYWHGNPKIFKPDTKMFRNLTANDLYQKTILRENKLRQKGFTVIYVWEYEYKQYLKGHLKKLPYHIKQPNLFILKGNIEIRVE